MGSRRHSRPGSWVELAVAWGILTLALSAAIFGPTSAGQLGIARIGLGVVGVGITLFAGSWVARRESPDAAGVRVWPRVFGPRWWLVLLSGALFSAAALQVTRPSTEHRVARTYDGFELRHAAALGDAKAEWVLRAADREGALAPHGRAEPRSRAEARKLGRVALESLPQHVVADAEAVVSRESPRAWAERLERRDRQRASAPRRALKRAVVRGGDSTNSSEATRAGPWLDSVLVLIAVLVLWRAFGLTVAAIVGAWSVMTILGRVPETGLALVRADIFALAACAAAWLSLGWAVAGGMALGILTAFEPVVVPIAAMMMAGVHAQPRASSGTSAPGSAAESRRAVPWRAWMGFALGAGMTVALCIVFAHGYDLGTTLDAAFDPPAGRLGFAVAWEYDGERTPMDMLSREALDLGRARIAGGILAIVWLAVAGWNAWDRRATVVQWADLGVVAMFFGVLSGWSALGVLALSMTAHASRLIAARNIFGAAALFGVAAAGGVATAWPGLPYAENGLVSVAIAGYALIRLAAELVVLVRRLTAAPPVGPRVVWLVALALGVQGMWTVRTFFSGGLDQPTRVLAAKSLRTPLRSGLPLDAKAVRVIDRAGVSIKLTRTSHARRLDMGLGVRQSYRLVFWNEMERIGSMTVRHNSETLEGLARIRKEVPEHLYTLGWDTVALYPESGIPPFAVGHFIFANDPRMPKRPPKRGKGPGRAASGKSKRGAAKPVPRVLPGTELPKLNAVPLPARSAQPMRLERGTSDAGATKPKPAGAPAKADLP